MLINDWNLILPRRDAFGQQAILFGSYNICGPSVSVDLAFMDFTIHWCWAHTSDSLQNMTWNNFWFVALTSSSFQEKFWNSGRPVASMMHFWIVQDQGRWALACGEPQTALWPSSLPYWGVKEALLLFPHLPTFLKELIFFLNHNLI